MLGDILATCPKMASRRLLMLSITGHTRRNTLKLPMSLTYQTHRYTSQYNIRPHVYHDYNHDDDDDNDDDDDSPPVLPAST